MSSSSHIRFCPRCGANLRNGWPIHFRCVGARLWQTVRTSILSGIGIIILGVGVIAFQPYLRQFQQNITLSVPTIRPTAKFLVKPTAAPTIRRTATPAPTIATRRPTSEVNRPTRTPRPTLKP